METWNGTDTNIHISFISAAHMYSMPACVQYSMVIGHIIHCRPTGRQPKTELGL